MTDRYPSEPRAAALWKNTVLAGLANYLDSGAILAGAVALTAWVEQYQLSARFVGLLGAFSANALSAGVGAAIGGALCDRFGRKRIYQYDMLLYAFGIAWLVLAQQPWMIVVGFVLTGIAVGADIPASWSLIAEMAPDGERGKHSGVAQVLWSLGPIVVLLLSLLLAPLGTLGLRIIFAHLGVIALALTVLRSRMQESPLWEQAAQESKAKAHATASAPPPSRALFTRAHLGAMAFLLGVYGIYNLYAGTYGFFLPYLLRTVGAQTPTTSILLQAAAMMVGAGSIWLIFMRWVDRVNQRRLFAVSSLIQVVGMALLALFPLTTLVASLHLFLMFLGAGFGAQPFFQLWSAELFPTLLRATAQGVTLAIARIGMGLWSFFVPVLTATGFTTLAWILTGFLLASGLVGVLWAPRHEGQSLEQIQASRQGRLR